MVRLIAGTSMLVFVPSLAIAGVPAERWPLFTAAAAIATVSISVSLLMVQGTVWRGMAVAAFNALVVAGLGVVLRDYYHQVPLLFAVVVVGHASIHGIRAALVAALLGAILLPFATVPGEANGADIGYAFIYLSGVALVIWTRDELRAADQAAIVSSEAKYRGLVERVPAVVYTAGLGVDGRWTYVSPRVQDLLGFPASAWTSDPTFWWSRIHPDDAALVEAEEIASMVAPPGPTHLVEYRMLDSEGRPRWVRDEATVIGADETGPAHWSGFLVDITDRKLLEQQLSYQAFHDPLTGLANRSLFADRVEHAMVRSARRWNSVAVLFLDLDDFKVVNDSLGHEAGDEVLKAVGRSILLSLRASDTAARLGGDEFAVLLEDLDADRSPSIVAERILDAVSRPLQIHGHEVVMSASIGIAELSARDETARDILRNADSAMFAAKRHGKGRHETYEPAMHGAATRRLQLSGDLRRALRAQELHVEYQPIVKLGDGSLTGFEALVRWNHPREGRLLPMDFIPLAEETGQITEVGAFVLTQACRQAQAWRRLDPSGRSLSISVNASARQFRDLDLRHAVIAALRTSGLPPGSLILEITESAVMDDPDTAERRLRELKDLGVRLAIDDFGTGYSSLSYLRRLPVDVLKIDKSFIDSIAGDGEALKLARVIMQIGRTLDLITVAEGVELPSQASALRRIGCNEAQGFLFARPMPSELATELISSSARLPIVGAVRAAS